MKKTKLLLMLSIVSLTLSSCVFDNILPKKEETPAPEETIEEPKKEPDNEFTVDYDSYMGKWYLFKSVEDEESCGEMVFKSTDDNTIKVSVNNYSGKENLEQLETLRFISEFTALGEGEFSETSSTKYQFTFKTNDETKEDLCEINIVDKNTKKQLSAPLYLYRISVRNTKPTPTTKEPAPKEPAPDNYAKPSKQSTFEQRALSLENYESSTLANAYTQQEINTATYNVFKKWDDLLNDVYQHLKSTLPSSEFNNLKKDEIAWIKEKENAIEKEAAEWAGGSAESMIRNSVATSYTKERCYYLISLVR